MLIPNNTNEWGNLFMVTKEKKKSKRMIVGIIASLFVVIIIVMALILANSGKVYFEDVPTYRLGETLEYEGVQITLVGYDEFTENSWATADRGKVFLFPIVEVVNPTDESYVIHDDKFDCYYKNRKVEDTANTSAAYAGYVGEGVATLGNFVDAGETQIGCIPLEVPAKWDTIELYFFDNLDEVPSFCLVVEK